MAAQNRTAVSDDTSDNDPMDALELGVAAAMARQYGEDSRDFLRSLASLLESALPGEASVARSGLFGGDKRPIRRIEIAFAQEGGSKTTRYAIEDAGHGPLSASKTQMVRGVALKTEPIDVKTWINEVGAAIARRAEESRSTRDALRAML